MDKKKWIEFWLKSSDDDWKVANSLFKNKDYSYSLFFAHLTVEKILKAIYVNKFNATPPYTHGLVFLLEKIAIEVTEEDLELFETITDFNLEARYPDENFLFKKKCTKTFTENYLKKIKKVKKWLLQQIQ